MSIHASKENIQMSLKEYHRKRDFGRSASRADMSPVRKTGSTSSKSTPPAICIMTFGYSSAAC